MDLTTTLLRATASRPRVLLAVLPGAAAVRLAAEHELRRCGLPVALTPADADVLLVAGSCCPPLETAIDRLWQDMPGPRALVRVEMPESVASTLASARARLADQDVQRASARAPGERSHPSEGSEDGSSHEGNGHGGHAEHGGGPQEGSGDQGHQSGDGGHGHHGGHQEHSGPEQHGGHESHGSEEMAMPGGLPMAEQGEDRDGLMLDRLHLPLGPLLSDWPPGLTLYATIQGDVIQQVEVDVSALRAVAPGSSFWTEPWEQAAAGEHVSAGDAVRRRAAAHLDSLGRFLAVAGWSAEATAARRLRDELLDGASERALRPRTRRLARRVGRSRTLYWLTRGIGPLSAGDAAAVGVGGPAGRADGDVPARYRAWLTAVLDDLTRLTDSTPLDPAREEGPRGLWGGARPASAALVKALPGLLEGAELAAARLIVASLDPDLDELAARPVEVASG